MKSCPKCSLQYTDDSLQFCLEDGTQLVGIAAESKNSTAFPGKTTQPIDYTTKLNNQRFSSAAFTDSGSAAPGNIAAQNAASPLNKQFEAQNHANEKVNDQILAVAPIALSITQNYWQWLYMARSDAFAFPAFLFSINFFVWFLLLTGGAALCVLALRRGVNKNLAVVGLIMLAINFLLCLVPRRY